MFIYKITDTRNNKCYIGFDTKPEYKQNRWKTHLRECYRSNTKFHTALRGNEQHFNYEVIDTADNIADLIIKEIKWIAHYNSYKKGYNSSMGGDGLNCNLGDISEEQYSLLKECLSQRLTEYNFTQKWAGKTEEERKELTAHLHTEDVIGRRTKTLKQYYDAKKKKKEIVAWQKANRQQLKKQNKMNALKAAEKIAVAVRVISPSGEETVFKSKLEFARRHGHIINRIIQKTKAGSTHNGWQGWEING